MTTATIALLPGDGIGPEVVSVGQSVLESIAARFGHELTFSTGSIGGCAIDATGEALPESTLELCRTSDAILLGAVGGPKWDDPSAETRPEQGLLKLRKELDLFANLRPITAHAQLVDASPLKREIIEGVDILFVRELTGGIYFGASGRRESAGGEAAYSEMVYETSEIERVVRVACEAARCCLPGSFPSR